MIHPLRNAGFEWHDLPIDRLSFGATGIEMLLLPYDEARKCFVVYRLQLTDAESVTLSPNGRLSACDLDGLEVTTFTFEAVGADRISGEFGIIPGSPSSGYWELGFTKARWRLYKA